jgi:septal ring factor EnvC (AmiA/AmiB activator)
MPKFILSLIFICFASQMWSQQPSQQQLEERKAKIQEEIREKEVLLQSVKKKEKSIVNQLIIQKDKIGLKEKLIQTTEKQTKLLSNDIYVNQLKINQLNRDLDDLRKDYAEMISKSYKSRSEQSRAMFLLSSENFLQAYKRAQYMKQYASYRKMQGDEIKSKATQLVSYNEKIGVQKTAKEKLIAENEKEKQELEKEKREQEKIAKLLQKDKGKITAEIKKKQKESKAIDRQIDKLIREAIAAANRKTAAANAKANPKTVTAAATKATVSATKIVLTPEGQLIANNFKANKGKLPWPVEKGVLSLGYGDQQHPIYKTLVVHNSGVEITTEKGSDARSVFGGEVTKIIRLSPLNNAVFIQHGDFFTIYQNLTTVKVNVGDKVSTKQSIGEIRTNGDTGKTILKFLILQNTSYNNPQSWLYNM